MAGGLSDRYVLEHELGRGGTAVVFLARDVRHRRSVALKVLRPTVTASLGVERFLREIETVAGLSHPHLIPLFDSGEVDGLPYYVTPHVVGESLRLRLDRNGALSLPEVTRIIREVAGALHYAHQRGFVHRDVKPANVIVDEYGRAILADFSIARALRRVSAEGMHPASPSRATASSARPGT
jgi:eukaryotic-like serine/threonine-protein kinase